MQAIVITRYGEPDVLRVSDLPTPEAAPGSAVVRVRAFGINHAESYFRRGLWGDVAAVSGIECAGEVHDAADTGLARGQPVFALMGGMGRSIPGSYAQYVRVPAAHIVPITADLPWPELAALPESYATAWTFVHHNLALAPGQTLVVRGGTSALGQAAINIARELGARVYASTRSREKFRILEQLGAEPLLEVAELAQVLGPRSVDAVLDIIGTSTLLDSFKLPRYGGRVAMAGFLGGGQPLAFDPLTHLPSGVQFSFFASAFAFGEAALPLSAIPFASFVEHARRGVYRAAPAHVFEFDQIVEAHRLLESGAARGKIVVRAS